MVTAPRPSGDPVEFPFPGLRPYGYEDADLFFGRERNIDQLLDKLRSTRFISVVGASGSGKSSLVIAGVMPRLDGGFRSTGGTFWNVVRMRPGADPIKNLARGLVEAGDPGTNIKADALTVDLTAAGLRRSGVGLVKAIDELQLSRGKNLLVLVDQFEEIFRFDRTGDRAHRDRAAAFVRLLLEAAKEPDSPVHVMITMRLDFLGDCTRFRGLPEAISRGQYLVPELERSQLKRAITGPLGVVGAEVDNPLLQRLLNDAGHEPDQLPLLQHALMRTYELWHRERPTPRMGLDAYEWVGALRGALSKHAEEAYEALSPSDRVVAERMFRCLTDRGDTGRGIRRPSEVGELLEVTGADRATLRRVVEMFRADRRSFLVLTPDNDSFDDEVAVDISHESLMRVWGRLRDWAREEAQSAAQLRLVADAARRCAAGTAGLWRDPELALALNWQSEQQPTEAWGQRYDEDVGAVQSFLRESSAEQDRLQAEARLAERRAGELKAITAQARKLKFLVALVAVLALGAAFLAETARRERDRASKQAAIAKAQTKMATDAGKQTKIALDAVQGLKDAAEATAKAALEAKAEAERQTDLADKAREKAEKAGRAARARAQEARAARRRTEAALREVEIQRSRAEDNAKKAEDNAQEAKKQREIAERLRAEAERRERITILGDQVPE